MRFSVSNFMSFGYKEDSSNHILAEEFYLYAGRSEQFKKRIIPIHERRILKFSSIYGANAAGKTNLVRAIDWGRRILLFTMDQGHIQDHYCRSQKANKERPTLFEYEFTIGSQCFAYGFTVNLWKRCILSEWLYELQGTREAPIFERSVEQDTYYFDEKRFSNGDNIQQFHFFLRDANRINTSLLLYELKRRKLIHEDFLLFSQIFDWFRDKLIIIYPDTKIGASYARFGSTNERLISILDYLDTGITGYNVQPLNETSFREYFPDPELADNLLHIPDGERKNRVILRYGNTLFELDYTGKNVDKILKLLFQHGAEETLYEYGEESDGTQRLIELLDVILNDDEEKVFIIDELNRSLHPQMTRKFVETFLNFSMGTKTQMIITTHESNLMDLSLLRRDEIWFAERETDNTTSLYTLEKFKTRYDKVVSKDYLAGRYGAVPVFKDFDYVWGRKDECKD